MRTSQGWLYLAVVLDLYSRRVVGHACGARAEAGLVVRALRAALVRRRPSGGWVHHADRGSVYWDAGYRALLRSCGARRSESRPGTPLDNAVVESFFSTLTREALAGRHFGGPAEARSALFDYIEVFYNRQRRHSTLGYLSPVAYESRPIIEGVSAEAG